MKTLNDFNKTYIKRKKGYYKRYERLEKQIEELSSKKKKLKYPNLIKIINPLIEEIKKKLNAYRYIHYGPFGLCSENSFYWENKKGKTLGSLTLISQKDGWAIRNEKTDTKTYPKGSIAEMNGANHPTIEITDKMNINWLLKFVRRGRC